MKYFKLLIFLAALNMAALVASAQANSKQSITIAPSPFPDNTTKPSVVVTNPQERTAPQNEVQQQSITVTPESKLSVGKASAVPATRRANQAQSAPEEKNKINYTEQKIEKQDAPTVNPSVNPK